MARTSVMTGGSNSFQTTSEDLNAVATDFLSDGIVGAVAATSGVAPMTGGLAVNAQGSPDRTVAVTAGYAYVTATPTSQASQRLRVKIDAQNLTHATNSSGSTRFDWIYVQVSASLAANPAVAGDTTGTMVISRSTSNSVDNGTPPTYGYHVATVTLANSYTTITNGNIADTRVQTGATANTIVAGTSVAKNAKNDYKFSVYRNSAWNQTGGAFVTPFDTKDYDTGTNIDVVTNKGRFTAPIAGFYHFDATVGFTMTTNDLVYAMIYKNGSESRRGAQFPAGSAAVAPSISDTIQLAAGDYIEIATFNGSGVAKTGAVTAQTHFSGFLVSAT